eukprot:216269-Chlamydomonas_euryale.AAC.1
MEGPCVWEGSGDGRGKAVSRAVGRSRRPRDTILSLGYPNGFRVQGSGDRRGKAVSRAVGRSRRPRHTILF